MDIPLYFAVLRRFKWIVLGGLVLGGALAALSYGRGSVSYESQAEALITQQSFPYGRAAASGSANAATAAQIGNSGVLAGLSPVYAQLANSDQIIRAVQRQARVPGTITASEVSDLASGANLPFIQLDSISPTAAGAVTLAQAEFNVLSSFIARQQVAAGISASDRVELILIQSGNPPKLASGHSSSIPMLVFVAVFGAAIAIAFMREKADPRTAAALGRVPAAPPHLVHGALVPNGVAAAGTGRAPDSSIHLVPGVAARPGQHVGVAATGSGARAGADRAKKGTSVADLLIRTSDRDSASAINSDV